MRIGYKKVFEQLDFTVEEIGTMSGNHETSAATYNLVCFLDIIVMS